METAQNTALYISKMKYKEDKKIKIGTYYHVGRDSSVGIATAYGLDGPGSNPGEGKIFCNCSDRP
jgi:hypothetical protein